jgi:hypothetical protein
VEQVVKIGDCSNCPFLHVNEEWDTRGCLHPANKGHVEVEEAIINLGFSCVSNNCPEKNVLIKFEK